MSSLSRPQPFLARDKQAFLVDLEKQKVIPTLLESITETQLIVDIEHSTRFYVMKSELWVIFPALPQQYYSLPTWIHGIYAGRLELGYESPPSE